MSEDQNQKRTPTQHVTVRFFLKLGKPKVDKDAFISAASRLGGLLHADGSNLDTVLAAINFALEDDAFWVERVAGAKDPVDSFCRNYETIEKQSLARATATTIKEKAVANKKAESMAHHPQYRRDSGQREFPTSCAACSTRAMATKHGAFYYCNDRCYPIMSKISEADVDGWRQAMRELSGNSDFGKEPPQIESRLLGPSAKDGMIYQGRRINHCSNCDGFHFEGVTCPLL